MKISRAENKRG